MIKLGDLNWRLAPLVSFLNAFGGWGFNFVRRLGVPAAIVLWAVLYYRLQRKWFLALYAALFLGVFLALRLPITLIGDSISGHFVNWAWIWILGLLQSASLFPLVFLSIEIDRDHYKKDSRAKTIKWIYGGGMHALLYGTLLTLSNTLGFPTHAWFEIIAGLSFGAVAAWIIGEQ